MVTALSSAKARTMLWTMQVESAEQTSSRVQEELGAVQAEAAQTVQRLGVAEAFRAHLERQLASAEVTFCDMSKLNPLYHKLIHGIMLHLLIVNRRAVAKTLVGFMNCRRRGLQLVMQTSVMCFYSSRNSETSYSSFRGKRARMTS